MFDGSTYYKDDDSVVLVDGVANGLANVFPSNIAFGTLSSTIWVGVELDFLVVCKVGRSLSKYVWVVIILCVPDNSSLREAVLTEAHSSPFSIHPGSTKIYRDLKQNFWWKGLFLSQKKYALQLLERAHMVHCNPSRTPVDTESKLGSEGVPVQDPTLYRSLTGWLQYLTFTRPDLSYVVQQVCLYMHDPKEPHFAAIKRILRYVRGIIEFGLQLYASATTSLVGYTNPYWAAKRQHTLSRSSAEAEYRGVANVVAETA
ncbi:ribonuclease H-like domain-containing protein [Tanacetum coccineum]